MCECGVASSPPPVGMERFPGRKQQRVTSNRAEQSDRIITGRFTRAIRRLSTAPSRESSCSQSIIEYEAVAVAKQATNQRPATRRPGERAGYVRLVGGGASVGHRTCGRGPGGARTRKRAAPQPPPPLLPPPRKGGRLQAATAWLLLLLGHVPWGRRSRALPNS
jgi:hypothetical protein